MAQAHFTQSNDASDLVGQSIGQYVITKEIGRGGMATVYKARQPSIDRYVAIKILPPQFTHDPTFVERFEREAKAIAALEHPHILPLYDFGMHENLIYMVMRYVTGGDLSGLMGKNLPPERIVEIIGDVAKALAYAHKNGVVHRDIKPNNILLDSNGEVLLTDFGIAKVENSQLTETGTILGTPEYMSPEQIEGTADKRSDIYSLGVVLYELLVGRPPYQAQTPLAIALKHLNEKLPPPHSINPDINEALEQVVTKALAKNPAERYQTAAEFIQGLKATHIVATADTDQTISQHVPITQRHPKPVQTTGLPNWLLASIGAMLVLLLIGAWFLLGDFGPPSSTTPKASPIAAAAKVTPSSPAENNTPQPTSALEGLLSGDILLQESFDSNRRNWPINEFDSDFGRYEAVIVNGRYRLSWEAQNFAFSWEEPAEAGEFDNFIATVDASPNPQSDPFGYGLVFRSTPEGFFYTFEIYTEGHFGVRLNTANQWQILIDNTPTTAIKNNQINQLAVKTDNSTLSFFINHQQVATVQDNTLKQGKIGLLITIEANKSATVDFDNLVIRDLPM